MEINFRQLLHMLTFMWTNAPAPRKYLLLPLALAAGLSRDWVMVIVNKAAAAPLDQALGYWLPMLRLSWQCWHRHTSIMWLLPRSLTT